MADKRYDEFTAASPDPLKIFLQADPVTGELTKIFVGALMGGGGGNIVDTLQDTLDAGFTSTGLPINIVNSSINAYNTAVSSIAGLDGTNGNLLIKSGNSAQGFLYARNLSGNDSTLEFPSYLGGGVKTICVSVNGIFADAAGNIAATPNLQAVTDVGTATTNSISSSGFITASSPAFSNEKAQLAVISGVTGVLALANIGSHTGNIKATDLTTNRDMQLPDASGTFALLSSASGTFTTVDGKTITVTNGIITAIV